MIQQNDLHDGSGITLGLDDKQLVQDNRCGVVNWLRLSDHLVVSVHLRRKM